MNEEQEIITILRIGMETQYYLLKGSVKMILKMLQLIKKLQTKGVVSGKAYDEFSKFVKATKGDFQILNLPTQDAEELKKIFEDFVSLGITYYWLPDLNMADGMTQIAYYGLHAKQMEGWMQSYCIKNMQGGEKELNKLQNLTQGQIALVNIPFNGETEKVKEDLDRLRINYAMLPDLNVGDGYIQLVYAQEDAGKLRSWFEMYQRKMMEQGESVGAMQEMTMKEYANTSHITPQEYEKTATAEIQRKIEHRNPERKKTVFEETLDGKENRMHDITDITYLEKKHQPGVREITINQELVVEPENGSRDFFISRIPGTYENLNTGQEAYYLFLQKKDVFVTDDGKTYVAFLEPGKTYYANTIREGKFHIGRKYSMQELEVHYARVGRKTEVKPLEKWMKEKGLQNRIPG